MTDKPTLDALVAELIAEMYAQSQRLKAIKRLRNSGNSPSSDELRAANSGSARIMKFSNQIESECQRTGRGDFGRSVPSLLQQLPVNLDEATTVQLQASEEALGLPAGVTIYALRTKASTGEPSQSENLWKLAFMVGLATIAAAGVGAPLAALATNQAIGPKVLEEAIITFASVAIAETGLAIVVQNRSQGAQQRSQPRFSRVSQAPTPEQQAAAAKRAEKRAEERWRRENRLVKLHQRRRGNRLVNLEWEADPVSAVSRKRHQHPGKSPTLALGDAEVNLGPGRNR